MNIEKVNTVKNILEGIGNRIATVSFTKRDGTERVMQLHKSQALIDSIKGTAPEATEARRWTLSSNGMMCVQELTHDHQHQWRTLNCNTVNRITCNGITRTFES